MVDPTIHEQGGLPNGNVFKLIIPFFIIHETLASILKELNYDTIATYRRTPEYLKRVCNLSSCFLIIDEANDLGHRIWPYMKRIIDAGIPIVFAGLPKVRTFLTSEHPDILSRLKTLVLYPIVVEDFIIEFKDIEQEAIEQLYMLEFSKNSSLTI